MDTNASQQAPTSGCVGRDVLASQEWQVTPSDAQSPQPTANISFKSKIKLLLEMPWPKSVQWCAASMSYKASATVLFRATTSSSGSTRSICGKPPRHSWWVS